LYTLWSYVVMANHVHVLIKPKAAQTSNCNQRPDFVPLKVITKALKGIQLERPTGSWA